MIAQLPALTLPALERPPQQGFLELFCAQCERSPASCAWLNADTGSAISYRELESLARRIRMGLMSAGIDAGMPVLVLLPSGPELIATFLALTACRAIAVVVADNLAPFELAPLLVDTAPCGVVWSGGELRQDVATLPSVAFALALASEAATVPKRVRTIAVPAFPTADVQLDAPPCAAIISCHATYKGTGFPLGVLHSYGDFSFVLERTLARLPEIRGAACLSAVSHVPIYGLINAALFPLVTGGCIVQLADLGRPDIFEVFRQHQIRFAPLVPLLLRLLIGRAELGLRRGARPEALLPGELRIVVGGSWTSEELLERAVSFLGTRPWQGYGTTETLIITAEHHGAERTGTLGVTDTDAAALCALDASGRVVQPGELGELYAASVAMFAGYSGRPDETARFLHDGWFRTGDLGRVDDDGFLHFFGRRLGFTKVASQMVDLEEMRRAFLLHPDVEDTRAAVHTDRAGLNHVMLAVRLRPGSSASPSELKGFAALHLCAHKLPRRIEIVASAGKGVR